MAFDLLPTLRPRQWHSTICVRVSRKWEYRGGTDDGPIRHVDLVDEKGNAMYGEIPELEVETNSPLVEEGSVYVISRFRVSSAKSGYRPVDSQYMVEFTLHTTISAARTDFPSFPVYAYKITPIHDLPSHAGDTKNFRDTIGILVEKTEPYMVHLPNKPAPTLSRHIVLRDLSHSEMKITLWGQRAAAFSTDAVNGAADDKAIVVLFVGGLVKSYQGTYYLSANATSRWYFNPDIPEAHPFYDSLRNQTVKVRSLPAPVQRQNQMQTPMQLQEKTLQELNQMDPYDFSENGYRCTVTIGRLVPNASWWFASCNKCSKSCVVDGAGYRCNACSTNSFKFKYRVCFVATDGIDEAEMVCFGDVARRMIGKPVQQVLRGATNSSTYPAYGHHNPAHPPDNQGDDHPDAPQPGQGLPDNSEHDVDLMSPSVTDTAAASSLIEDTPPPTVETTPTKPTKNQTEDGTRRSKRSNVQRRLFVDDEDSDEELIGKHLENDESTTTLNDAPNELTGKRSGGAGKKRSRGNRAMPQESG